MTLKASDAEPVTNALLAEIDRLRIRPPLAALALAHSLAIVVHGAAKNNEHREAALLALLIETKHAMRTLAEIDATRST